MNIIKQSGLLNRERTMPQKILIIATSPRKGGNSETLAEAFARGAKDAGHNVEMYSLRDKKIAFCRGCLACPKKSAASFMTTLTQSPKAC